MIDFNHICATVILSSRRSDEGSLPYRPGAPAAGRRAAAAIAIRSPEGTLPPAGRLGGHSPTRSGGIGAGQDDHAHLGRGAGGFQPAPFFVFRAAVWGAGPQHADWP